MGYQIKGIQLKAEDFSKFSIHESEGWLKNLSKINIFVGENNSGKSRFLRQLALIESLDFLPTASTQKIEKEREIFVDNIKRILKTNNVADSGALGRELQRIVPFSVLQERALYLNNFKQTINLVMNLNPENINISFYGGIPDIHRMVSELKEFAINASKQINEYIQISPEDYKFDRVYIPTLRGLRNFSDQRDWYAVRTKADYFSKGEHINIFTGLSLYEELKMLLLGDLDQRETVAEFQDFLGDAFFDKQPVVLIPKYNQDVLDVKIGEEAQRPIYSLGDGIQALITLTFSIFRHKGANLLLFIEEPELFMHPGMQRVFMNVLLRPEFANAQYFITTHSNHLLDLTLDIESVSIYTFKKELQTTKNKEKDTHIAIENVSNEDERILQLLGIQNSSVFLSNCTIWVEGITDRRYLSRYLEVYQNWLLLDAEKTNTHFKQLKQDLHYSFVEYAGANITHWSFLDDTKDPILVGRLCGKLFLITDKDTSSGKKGARHDQLRDKLVDRYYCLECREIENLLSPEILSGVVASYEGKDATLNTIEYSQYKDKPLGEFIEEKIINGEKKRRGSYKEDSGTITDKNKFCELALIQIKNWSDLSVEAKALTEKIYNFILSKNT